MHCRSYGEASSGGILSDHSKLDYRDSMWTPVLQVSSSSSENLVTRRTLAANLHMTTRGFCIIVVHSRTVFFCFFFYNAYFLSVAYINQNNVVMSVLFV